MSPTSRATFLAPYVIALVSLGAFGVLPRHSRAWAGGAEPASWDPGTTWALLIGVLEWKSADLASYPKAHRADRLLESALYARGVPERHVTFLEDKGATLAACREALRSVALDAGPGSTLLIYYAGHGMRVGEQTFFCPYDTDPKDPGGTAFGHDEIAKVLSTSWRGSRLLLLADCCYSGGIGSVVTNLHGAAEPKAAAMTSALASSVSTGNWTFTASVGRVFLGDGAPDADGNGTITFAEAERFVRREMRWRESQLAGVYRSSSFEPGFVLARVFPAQAIKHVPGPLQIGDYSEVERKGDWVSGQVLDVSSDGRTRIRFLGLPGEDEWVESARLRARKPIGVEPGTRIEIEWAGTWWPGSVRETQDEFALVRYAGYGPEWDEWVGALRIRRLK